VSELFTVHLQVSERVSLFINFKPGEMQRMIDGKQTLHAKIARIVFYFIIQ